MQERDGSNNVSRSYVWDPKAPGGIGGLLELSQTGQQYSYLYNGKGNVISLLDGTQAPVATYTYDEFGNQMVKSGTLNQPFRFSTKAYDEKTGLSYYGYRFYTPVLGRWINKDPLREAGGINLYGFVDSVGKPQTNLYQYTENNPVNKTDPLGLWSVSVGAGGFGNIGMIGTGADSGIAVSNNNVCFYSTVCGAGGWNTPAGGMLGLVGQFSKSGKLCSGTETSQGGYWYGGDVLGGEGQVLTNGNGVQYGRGIVGVTGGAGGGYMRCTTQYYCVR